MPARRLLRDSIRSFVPTWLSDRTGQGKTVGFRFLWSMVAPLDAALDMLIQGITAAWPGLGTPTALPLVGRSRGIVRGQGESDDGYAARLRAWIDIWRTAGSAERVARIIHDYCSNHPRVRVVSRAGTWVTVEQDGTMTRHPQRVPIRWDDVSHPERAGWWSEMWIIVYPSPWATPAKIGGGAKIGQPSGLGLGHATTREEYTTLRGLLSEWKAAHSRIRAIVWTSDPNIFNAADPATLPDGQWGAWSDGGQKVRGPSHRNTTTCRYWEM